MGKENTLNMIALQTKTITQSIEQIKEMLTGCEEMAKDNFTTAKSIKEFEIAFKYEHLWNDIGSLVRQTNMILKSLEDEKRNERNAMFRAKGGTTHGKL